MPDQVGKAAPLALLARHPVHITQGRLQIVVSEQALQLMYRQALLQLVGRIGMSQAMDAADLVDPRARFGAMIDPLGGADVEVAPRLAFAGKQPGLGPLRPPVATQPLQQGRGDQRLAVLGALALLDAQQAALTVDSA